VKQAPDSERLRQAWLAMTSAATGERGCPDPDRIWEALQGGLDPKEVMAIVQHTADCPVCAQAWRLAKDMGAMQAEAEPEPVRPAEVVRPSGWSRIFDLWRLRPLALAAGLAGLLVLGAGAVWLWPDRGRQGMQTRDLPGDAIRSLIPEEQALPKTACLLKWTPGPAGTRYTVRVSTEKFEQISLVEGLEAAEYLVPTAALEKLKPGARLLWQVQAFPPKGGRQISGTFFVTLE